MKSYETRIANAYVLSSVGKNATAIGVYGEPWDTLCSQIVRENFKEYYEHERIVLKLSKKKHLTVGEQQSLTFHQKKMQKCVDFFHSYYGNLVAFYKGDFLCDCMVNHQVNVNKLKRSKNY